MDYNYEGYLVRMFCDTIQPGWDDRQEDSEDWRCDISDGGGIDFCNVGGEFFVVFVDDRPVVMGCS